MENIKGWAVDLKAVYGNRWKDRDKFHLSEDLWESPDGNIAGLIYGIAEVGISKEVGRLAVLRCKEKPELAFNLPKFLCWYLYDSAVQFGKNEHLFVHRFKSSRKILDVDLFVLDASKNRYAFIASLPKNFYNVRYIEGMKYGFTEMSENNSAEIFIDLKDLAWKPITRKGGFLFTSSFILYFFAWSIPLLMTAVYAYVIYLFSQITCKGTVDLVMPDGPLANETNFGQIWRSLAYPGPVLIAYILGLWRLSKKKTLAAEKAFLLFFWALVLLLLSPLVYMGLNALLDHSETLVYKVSVVDKYESVDVNTATNPVWRLTLSSWRPGRIYEILGVTKDEFDQVQPQKGQVVLRIKPGYFGYPWIESYAIAPKNNGGGE
jgi:hypothetical protein